MPLIPLRDRNVTISLVATRPVQTPTDNLPQPATLTNFKLAGVQSMSISRSQDIGQSQGLNGFFLQPWYFKAVEVSVRGESYLGAFVTDIVNLTADLTRNDMLHLVQLLDEVQGDPDRIVNLIIGDEVFQGYITNFRHQENVSKPFIIDYDISFIGKELVAFAVSNGIAQGIQDGRQLIQTVVRPIVSLVGVFL